MKHFLYLIILFALPAHAQYTLTAIDNGYSVNGNYYPFNVTGLTAPTSDTTYAGLIILPNRTIVPLSKISTFKRSNGVAFANRQALINFYDSFISNIPVLGTYVAITDSNVNGGYATPTYVAAHGGGGSPQDSELHVFNSSYVIEDVNGNDFLSIDPNNTGTVEFGDITDAFGGAKMSLDLLSQAWSVGGEFTTGGGFNANGGLTWNKGSNTNTLPSGRAAAGEVPTGVGDGSMVWAGLPVVANLSIVGVNAQATYTFAHGQSFTPTTVLLIGANSDCLLLGNYFIGTVDSHDVTVTFATGAVGTPTYNFKAVYFR